VACLLRLAEEDAVNFRYIPLALFDDFIAALALASACVELRLLDPLLPDTHAYLS
jgi:hypothetical protein